MTFSQVILAKMLRCSFPFMPVTFVTGTESVNSSNTQDKIHKNINLDGKAISEFYKKVISTPSTTETVKQSKDCDTRKNVHKIKKSAININTNVHDMFRYAESGDIKGMEKCLKFGLDINSVDRYGWSPLMCASCAGSSAMVKYLLKNCANRDLCDLSGKKAIDLALQFNHNHIAELLQKDFVEIKSEQKEEEYNEIYFCKLCKTNVSEKKQKHKSSIIHQMNVKRSQKSNYYYLSENNKGFQIMLRKGWNKDTGLGPNGIGNKYPIKTVLKRDRLCLGNKNGNVPRITHFQPFDVSSVERQHEVPVKLRQNTLSKRERMKQERKKKQKEINFRREFY